jgi:hypothetical protein
MPLPSGHIVTADEFSAATGSNSVEFRTTSLTLSTTSASFVDIPGASTSFTKVLGASASNIVVVVSLSLYSTVVNAAIDIGVNVNGTDVVATNFSLNTTNHSTPPTGVATFTGLAAGTYTVKARVRRNSGTGTLTQDGTDSVLMLIREKLT